MRTTRRRFVGTGLASAAVVSGCGPSRQVKVGGATKRDSARGVVISTWSHGVPANEAAAATLKRGGSVLDAVEAGVRVPESDPEVRSVGKGGYPNAAGVVQLDACIMDGPTARAGAVASLEEIENPISVARLVMEKTPHVLLVGPGAQEFALANGFRRTNLLTEASRAAWEKWKATPPDAHDTIGMCGLDERGRLAVACTTSGLSWKLPGRVGDSPIIGAGAFVDQEVGAASATGVGEEVLQTCGSFLVVENMRRGMSPTRACEDAVRRILRKHPDAARVQVAYIALRSDGAVGAYSIRSGFQYAHFDGTSNRLVSSADFAVAD